MPGDNSPVITAFNIGAHNDFSASEKLDESPI
jgi:hypothetical protein